MDPIWIAVGVIGAIVLVVLLLRLTRRGERVIDSGPVASTTTAPQAAGASAASGSGFLGLGGKSFEGPGEILEARGVHDAECGIADWLMEDINRVVGTDLDTDQMVIQRVADIALKASADLKATGRAVVELPYIAATADGPKHYRREITRDEAELGMIDHGILLVDELLQWRGHDAQTVSLGGWLEAEADEESGESLDPPSTRRMADAAEQAMDAVTRTGRAIVDLPGLVAQNGSTFHFRREFDRAAMEIMLGDAG